jgi:cellulose synthase/poly-beta-1,6-N-acetylglucosamine synthase-like glycosyltransferase
MSACNAGYEYVWYTSRKSREPTAGVLKGKLFLSSIILIDEGWFLVTYLIFGLDPGIVIGLIWTCYVSIQIILVSIHRFPAKDRSFRPFTSIIIAAWKEGDRVRTCVESLLAQSYPKNKMEIIVVGGGEAHSVAIIRKLADDGKITFIERRDESPKWESVNIGIRETKGDVLAFIDADCVAPSDWLERLNQNFCGDVMGVVGYAIPLSDSNFISKAHWISFPALIFSMNVLRFPVHCGACSAFKKEAFTHHRLEFRNSLIEDLVFTHEARKRGVKYVFDKNSFVKHAFPTNLIEYDKGVKRIVSGMLRDLPFHPIIFFNLLFPMISIAYFAITSIAMLHFPAQTFSIDPISSVIGALPAAYVMLVMKRLGITKFKYLPHFFILTSLASILYFKNTIRFLLRRKTYWVIYKKA